MTEPEVAGSDPTLIRTTAVLDGDEYVINGHKWFSSNASISDFLIVMVKTGDFETAYKNYSMIIVPTTTAGVNIVRDVPTMGEPTTRPANPAVTPRSSTTTFASRSTPSSAVKPVSGKGLR